MAEKLTDVVLVWGTPGDIELKSDGGGEYASTFRLTPRGAAKIAKALGATTFRDAEFCGHEFPEAGDTVHVAGESVDTICLASPMITDRTMRAPWESDTGCFGHCDPEGWAECANRTAGLEER